MKISVKIIHPIDPSTDFLLSISQSLNELKVIDLEIVRPNINESIQSFSSLQECDTILFLGHGHSRWLYGGTDSEDKIKLISTKDAVTLFRERRTILFACNSNDFLTELNRKTVVTKNYLGFGNMPTDWGDIIGQRDSEPDYRKGLEEVTLEKYKELIVDSLSESLQLFFIRKLTFRELYLELRLRINRQVNLVAFSKEFDKSEKKLLISMLVEHRDEIIWK